MGDFFYQSLCKVLAPFAFRCLGSEHIRDSGPGIYVGNHLGSIGPIQAVLSLPVRLYPWLVADMVDPRRAPRYLYDDFVQRAWHFDGRLGLTTSAALARVTVPLLKGIGSVPVEDNGGQPLGGFRRSLEVLAGGKNLLIFPEDSLAAQDPATQMRPFLGGFVLLASLYRRRNGIALPIYPIGISIPCHTVSVGPAVLLDAPYVERRQIAEFCKEMRDRVWQLAQDRLQIQSHQREGWA